MSSKQQTTALSGNRWTCPSFIEAPGAGREC